LRFLAHPMTALVTTDIEGDTEVAREGEVQ
jgi:hypothetical protein